jgi:hypothetical protein
MVRGALRLGFIAATLTTGCNSLFGIQEGTPRPICTDSLLIDDMEDGEGAICPSDGRTGYWYTGSDGTSTDLTPALEFNPTLIKDGSRGTSQYAARMTGSGFTIWGALMGFNLNAPSVGTGTIDVSAVKGIRFWMRSNAPVRVDFQTPETIAVEFGGECVGNNCGNHLGFQISAPGSGWVEYQVPFAALTQRDGGSVKWNRRSLVGLQFQVPANMAFDVWVDDIRFLPTCAVTGCSPTCTDPDYPQSCPENDRDPAACRPPATDCAAVQNWCAGLLMIDDMEDADGSICRSGGRQGKWSTNGYDTLTTPDPGADLEIEKQTIIPGGRGESHYAAHMAGAGITGLARMGFDLNDSSVGWFDYDGSAYDGIRFWLKSDVPVIVGFTSAATLPVSLGGTCDLSPTHENCNHHYEVTTPATGGEWLDSRVPFSALRQAADRNAPVNPVPPNATWDSSRMRSIAFLTSSPDFDVWIDDIAFYMSSPRLGP